MKLSTRSGAPTDLELVSDPDDQFRSFLRDAIVNYSGQLVSGVLAIFLIPLLLGYLGPERYGTWMAALSFAGMFSILDFGLAWPLTRDVARLEPDREEAAQLVESAKYFYVLSGFVGFVLICLAGFVAGPMLKLSPALVKTAPIIFALSGLEFFGNHLQIYVLALLHGVRRFGLSTLPLISGSVLRFAGTVALIAWGGGLISIMVWHASVSLGTALISIGLVGRLHPRFGLAPGSIEWRRLIEAFRFGFFSQLMGGLVKLSWNSVPLLIGVARGSAAIVPYYVAQKFPFAMAEISWRGGEVVFPRASHEGNEAANGRLQSLIAIGTRAVLILVLPVAIVLFVVAPDLLRVWMGELVPQPVMILRLLTVGVFADAIGVTAMHVLWARGSIRLVVAVYSIVAGIVVVLTAALVRKQGVSGAAVAFLIGVTFGAAAFMWLAARMSESRVSTLLRECVSGLIMPAVACGAVSVVISQTLSALNWLGIVRNAATASVAFLGVLYMTSHRAEEKRLVVAFVTAPARVIMALLRSSRRMSRKARDRE